MRRFWLLLLIVVLPLQMSWAAVHLCDGEAAAIATAAPKAGDQLAHSHDSQATQSQGAEILTDACCGAVHGCHGLHNLMAQAAPAVAVVPSRGLLTALDERMAQRQFADRHERPQWLAA